MRQRLQQNNLANQVASAPQSVQQVNPIPPPPAYHGTQRASEPVGLFPVSNKYPASLQAFSCRFPC